jgi:hypothetical protein
MIVCCRDSEISVRVIFPSGRGAMRLADAQTGRPYSG